MDRGYVDFARLHAIHLRRAFFVIRAKVNLDFRRIGSRPVDKAAGVRCDQVIRLCGPKSRRLYPEPLRRIVYRDPETGKRLVFLTNILDLPALVIARLYKCRWRIELFFKWIKQNLRLLRFYGTSPNAVKTQVWIAVCVYALVVTVHRASGAAMSLSQMLQIFSVTPFEKVPIAQLLTDQEPQVQETSIYKQLVFTF
jgi:IS4 transposase